MQFGTVTSYHPEKGYGLIAIEGSRKTIPVYQAAIDAARLGQIAERQRLAFKISNDIGGPSATHLWTTWADR